MKRVSGRRGTGCKELGVVTGLRARVGTRPFTVEKAGRGVMDKASNEA